MRAPGLLREIHQLARAYGWSEREIVSLTVDRRAGYLMLLEEEADAALLAGLHGSEVT